MHMSVLNPTPPVVGRAPTPEEEQDYRGRFPALGAFRVTDEPTDMYNCVSWTLGIVTDWLWPDQTGPNTTTADFDAFYAQYNYVPVSTASLLTSGSAINSQADIALYALNGDCKHVARVTPNDPWWESKLGSGFRAVHLLADLRGQHYGQAVRYYRDVNKPRRGSGPDSEPTLAFELAPAVIDVQWGEVAVTMQEPIRLTRVTTFSDEYTQGPTYDAFMKAYEQWQKRVSEPDIMLQSNPKAYVDVPEFGVIVALGNPALPYIVTELAKGAFWLNYALERITHISPPPHLIGQRQKSEWWLKWWSDHH